MNMEKRKTPSLKKYSISDREFLNRKLKTSSHYTSVKSKTNSGVNANRRHEMESEIRKYYKIKNDEVFRRISLGELLQLMMTYADECRSVRCDKNETSNEELNPDHTPLKYKDNIQTVVHKTDELEMPSGSCRELLCPFLIIDVRSETEFDVEHIATSICYPHHKLSRAVGWECPEMIMYKNHANLIIITYDENENLSPTVASTMIYRGYENTFVLSGGLKLARDKIGFPLLTADKTRTLSPFVVDFFCEKFSASLISPLSVDQASRWWVANSSHFGKSGCHDSGDDHLEDHEESHRGRAKSRT